MNAEHALPHNLEAEKKVLGACFQATIHQNPDAIFRVQEILQPQDFYHPGHEAVFTAIAEMSRQGIPADLTGVMDWLEKHVKLQSLGSPLYLIELVQSVVSSANIEFHAQLVKEKSIRRQLIRKAQEIENSAYTGSEVDEITRNFNSTFFEILSPLDKKKLKHIADIKPTFLDETQNQIERFQRGKIVAKDIETGFCDLDRFTGGLDRGELLVIGARPSEGKTSFAIRVAANIAKTGNVIFFSLEMGERQIRDRLICGIANVSLQDFYTGKIDIAKAERTLSAANEIESLNFFIDDSRRSPIEQIAARAERFKIERGLIDAVVIDYLQLIPIYQNHRSRNDEVSFHSREIKLLAGQVQAPVILLSQLSRDLEKDGKRNPRLSDLRDSGSIEQDADQVWFIHRPDGVEKDTAGEREILIAKNRNGKIGKVSLFFEPSTMMFGNFKEDLEF